MKPHTRNLPAQYRLHPLFAILSLVVLPAAHAADFTVPAGGSFPAVSTLDSTGSNTITLQGDVTMIAAYQPAARLFVLQSDDLSSPRTVTQTGASYFIRITSTGVWGFDGIVLTGGSNATASIGGGAVVFHHTVAGTNTVTGNFTATNNWASRGGAINTTAATTDLVFTGSTAFLNNTGTYAGGAIYASGNLTFEDSAYFDGNTGGSSGGGAIFMLTNTKSLRLEKNAIFTSNTSASHGGAIVLRGDYYIGGSSTFTNNISTGASAYGGAIFMFTQDNTIASGTFDASLGDITFKGNMMRTTQSSSIYVRVSTSATSNIFFNTGTGASAHTIAFYDPINSYTDATFGSTFTQNGDGVLLFDTHSSTPWANLNINSGTFRLTNGALYGTGTGTTEGGFTLASAATLSGNGTVRSGTVTLGVGSTLEVLGGGALTIEHDTALVGATGLTLLGSGTIDAGGALSAAEISVGTLVSANPELPDATVNTAQTLSFADTTPVTLENGGIINIDLFGSGISDLLNAGAFSIAGTGTINLVGAGDGSYKIITTTNDISAAGLVRTVNGAIPTNRYAADLRYESAGTETWVDFATKNLAQTWTGAGSTWKNSLTTDANWTDGDASTPETFFFNGDRVTFGDTGAGAVAVDAAGVVVADMLVNATADYTFAGDGGITASTSVSSGLVTPATGKLVKQGTGALLFTGTGNNSFEGGITLQGGVLGFTHGGQLGEGGNGITFANSGTLRAMSGTTALAVDLILSDAATAGVVDVVAGGTLTHTGQIRATAGSFIKDGDGTLVLAGDNSTSQAAATLANKGSLLLATGAKLGGIVTVANGAIFGGSGSASSIITNGGATLQVGDLATGGVLYAGALDLAAGTTLSFAVLGANQSSSIQIDTTPILAGGNIADNYTINISEWIVGTYTLGNIALLEDATLTLRGSLLNARQLYTTATNASNMLEITLQATANGVLVWNGTNAGGIDTGKWNSTAENWLATGSPMAFADYDVVVFNDDVSDDAFRTVDLPNSMVVSDMVVSGMGDYRFEGAGGIRGDNSGIVGISGSSKLVKTGTGTLTFANTGGNLFKGGIEIGSTGAQGGIIAFDRGNQLAVDAGSAITFLGDGTLSVLADMTETNALGSAIAVGDGVTASFDTGNYEATYSGSLLALGASGTFAKIGDGQLNITGTTSSANLAFDVTQGAVQLAGGTLDAVVYVRNGVTFGGWGSVGETRVESGATFQVADGGLSASNLRLGNAAILTGQGTLGGSMQISGSATALIAPTKQLTLSATTSGDGTLIKSGQGTLVYSGTATLGHAATSINEGVVMLRDMSGFPITSGSHAFIINGGWLDLSEGLTFDETGDTAIDWSGLRINGNSGRVIGSNDKITLGAGDVAFDIGSPDDTNKQGLFVVVDAGNGVATMTGSNNYAGYTLLKSGTLQVSNDAQLGIISDTLYREVVFDGGALLAADGFATGRVMDIRSEASVGVQSGDTASWNGNISGNGALTKTGEGTLILSGENDYTGGTVIAAGRLEGNSASLQGDIQNNAHLVFNQTAQGDFSGTIRGASGTVTKMGSAALTISGELTAAAFNLNAGTLILPTGKTITAGSLNNKAVLKIGRAGGSAEYGAVTLQGDYFGDGGKLYIGLYISGTTMRSDRLHVTGNISGDTMVDFGQIVTASAIPDGFLPNDIISWDSSISEGAIVQSTESVLEFGGVRYTWGPNAEGTAGVWTPDAISAAPALLGIDASAMLIGKAAFSSVSQRMMFQRLGNGAHSLELWVNGAYRRDKIRGGGYSSSKVNIQGVQVGGDWCVSAAENDRKSYGFFYDYAKSDLDVRRNIADADTESHGVGFYFMERTKSWYMDLILRYAKADFDVAVPNQPSFSTKGENIGASVEFGYIINLKKNWLMQPYAQIVGQHLEIDNTVDAYGRAYRIYNITSLETRGGISISREYRRKSGRWSSIYARGSYAYDFEGEGELHVVNTLYRNNFGGGVVAFDMGLAAQLTKTIKTGVEISAQRGANIEGYGVNLNIALAW